MTVLGPPPAAAPLPDPVTLRLPFTQPPVTANDARRAGHWSAHARPKRTVQEAVYVIARAERVPPMERVAVTLTWYRGDYGRCDPDGLAPMVKACIDALTPPRPALPKGSLTTAGTPRERAQAAKTGAGVLRDDDASVVESVTLRIVLGDPDPRVELHLLPLPPARPRVAPRNAKHPRSV